MTVLMLANKIIYEGAAESFSIGADCQLKYFWNIDAKENIFFREPDQLYDIYYDRTYPIKPMFLFIMEFRQKKLFYFKHAILSIVLDIERKFYDFLALILSLRFLLAYKLPYQKDTHKDTLISS